MKKFLFFAACAILCACEPQFIEPGSSLRDLPTPGFTWEIDGLTVTFTNTSTPDLTLDYWEFGDGHNSTTDNPSHTYAQAGTYRVVLHTKTNTWSKYTCAATIDVKGGGSQGGGGGDNPGTDPQEISKVFITGIQYMHIEYDNRVYRAKLLDDDNIWRETIFETIYTGGLTNADLPYTQTYGFPVELKNYKDHDYYELYIYQSQSFSGDGKQCLKQKIVKSKILTYQPYIEVVNSTGNTIVRLLMRYE